MTAEKIGILYNEPLPFGAENWESSRDVLDQVEAITNALQELGHQVVALPFAGRLPDLIARLADEKIDLAFNLCESVNENPKLIGHPAAVLELMGIPFSGSPALALMISTDKLLAKQLLLANEIKTPDYLLIDKIENYRPANIKFPVIIKPRFEDASIGIDQDSICHTKKELAGKVEIFFKNYGQLLVEEYIPGREFNVSLLGFPEPQILPIAEIDFSGLPDGLFPIVGYRAKWDKKSPEYNHTPRTFPESLPIYFSKALRTAARDCFRAFMLRDYGRVDVRVDERNRIFVLEANANPCLSPDAGFIAAATARNSMDYTELTRTLISFIRKRKNHA